jgi:uncharacterized protein YceK
MKRLWFFLGIMTMVGCATVLPPTMTYLPDGRQGYTIECSDSMECYQQAGWTCGGRGYEIVAAKIYSPSILTQSVVIACK